MQIQNLIGFKGKNYKKDFVILDNAGNAVSLLGKTGTFKVYLNIPGLDDTFVINKAITIDDAFNGKCSVTLSDTEMTVYVNVYSYYLEILYATGSNRIMVYGTFQILGDDTVRLEAIKQKYGLNFEYNLLLDAYNYAHSEMKKNAFVSVNETTHTSNKVINIDNYVMDSNFDGVVDKNDILISQYMTISPYTVEDLSSKINSVIFNHPAGKTYITMLNDYPTSNYKLNIEYYKGINTYANLKVYIDRIEELYIIIYLFEKLDPYQLQRGLPDRTINGITIKYDQEGVQKTLINFRNLLNNEINKIKPFIFKNVLISKKYNNPVI